MSGVLLLHLVVRRRRTLDLPRSGAGARCIGAQPPSTSASWRRSSHHGRGPCALSPWRSRSSRRRSACSPSIATCGAVERSSSSPSSFSGRTSTARSSSAWSSPRSRVGSGSSSFSLDGRTARDAVFALGLLALAPWVCLIASPYGTDVIHYFRVVIVDSPIKEVASEWHAPGVPRILDRVLPGRRGSSSSWRSGSAAGSRSSTSPCWRSPSGRRCGAHGESPGSRWPSQSSSRERSNAQLRPMLRAPGRLARWVTGIVVCLPIAVFVGVAPDTGRRVEELWPPAGASAIAAAAATIPGTPAVWPSDKHADWLLWREPSLRGRVAFDSRFELLPTGLYPRVVGFKGDPGWLENAEGYPILVFDPTELPRKVRRAPPDAEGQDALLRSHVGRLPAPVTSVRLPGEKASASAVAAPGHSR